MISSYRYFLPLLISFLSILSISSSLYCGDSSSTDKQKNVCFIEKQIQTPIRLKTSGTSLVLPCHLARATKETVLEWWFVDSQKHYHIRIHPVFPAVRPLALRFVTGLTNSGKLLNETDIIDGSILLRHLNVDDTGFYSCIARSLMSDSLINIEDLISNEESNHSMLKYQLEINAPRICQLSPSTLPCFSSMRSSSPTLIDAYQTTFLQCLVNNFNRPINVFWVIGNLSTNSVLITDYLPQNQYKGDKLRRIFPLSPFDYSIELSVNRSIYHRTYSCVIDGASDIETTLFTYIVRTIEIDNEDKHEQTTTPIILEEQTESVDLTTEQEFVSSNSSTIEKELKINSNENSTILSD